MKKSLVFALFFLTAPIVAFSQSFVFSGKVISSKGGEAVEYATVVLQPTNQWAVSDENGSFVIKNVQGGNTQLLFPVLAMQKTKRSSRSILKLPLILYLSRKTT